VYELIQNKHRYQLNFIVDMVRADCKDYGFDCDFMSEGNIEKVVQEFGKHTKEKHGIEYSEETITKYMLNKSS
jgi:predicted small metal-binding protein